MTLISPEQQALLAAVSLAARRHRGQCRGDGQTPYVAHPVRVAFILTCLFGETDPRILAAAVLHDTLEDTATDRDDLAALDAEVASWVALLTKDHRLLEGEREQVYLQALAAAPVEVQLCKLADLVDNLLDLSAPGAPARVRTLGKAEQLLAALAPDAPPRLATALALARQLVAEARDPAGSPPP